MKLTDEIREIAASYLAALQTLDILQIEEENRSEGDYNNKVWSRNKRMELTYAKVEKMKADIETLLDKKLKEQRIPQNIKEQNAINISFLAGLIEKGDTKGAYESLALLHRDLVDQGVVALEKDFTD